MDWSCCSCCCCCCCCRYGLVFDTTHNSRICYAKVGTVSKSHHAQLPPCISTCTDSSREIAYGLHDLCTPQRPNEGQQSIDCVQVLALDQGFLSLQEKKEALAKITEKVDNLQQVEHWQELQEMYSKVIAWEQVSPKIINQFGRPKHVDLKSSHQQRLLTALQPNQHTSSQMTVNTFTSVYITILQP